MTKKGVLTEVNKALLDSLERISQANIADENFEDILKQSTAIKETATVIVSSVAAQTAAIKLAFEYGTIPQGGTEVLKEIVGPEEKNYSGAIESKNKKA